MPNLLIKKPLTYPVAHNVAHDLGCLRLQSSAPHRSVLILVIPNRTQMKHLMTLMALVVAVTAGAQGTTIHEYPWNPDSNNDNQIGVDDLMGLLSTYGTEFGNPPEPCDYDGTPLEELLAGITNGDIILDSIFIEYELEDVSTYYPVGCPDSVTDTLIFAESALLTNFSDEGSYWRIYGCAADYCHQLYFYTTPSEGLYRFSFSNDAINQLGFVGDGFFWHW